MSELKYTLENLRALMAESPAYQGLSDSEKAAIESHIQANNKPMLMYIFQQLREESEAHALGRQKLAEKVLQIKQSDQQKLTDDLRHALDDRH